MTKKALFIWIFLLVFGFSSMPDIGFANTTKHPGKTELTKKKSPKKHKKSKRKRTTRKSSKKKYSKRTKVTKHKKKGSKNKRSAGKKKSSRKYSKKYSKGKKHGKTKYKKGSKKYKRSKSRRHSRSRRTIRRYSPPTNNGSVEYRNYKRNSDADNQSNESIDKIAPPKEIKKEPKKEGE